VPLGATCLQNTGNGRVSTNDLSAGQRMVSGK
jgi:hypothetical protein